METKNAEQLLLKKGLFVILSLIGLEAGVYFLYDLHEGWLFMELLNLFVFIFHITGLLVVRKYSYENLRAIMPIYLISLVLLLSPEVYFYFCENQLTGILWFIPLAPFSLRLFFPSRKGMMWGILIVAAVIVIYFLQQVLPRIPIESLTREQQAMANFFSILFALINNSVLIYLIFKRDEAKNQCGKVNPQKASIEKILSEEEIEKYKQVYGKIINYFEEKKVYRDGDLTLSKLAVMMNMNTNYIYKAIRLQHHMNFNTFVNSYRINMIKNMIEEGWSEKYTIQHIYTSAGFKYQTTFNKVFKSFEGMSPSDYIALVRSKKI